MAPATTGERISRGSFRVEIHCPLQVSGPLHVGSGQRLSTMSDAPILRLSDGTAYIPGSTPRGVIRDWCEREAPRLGVSRAALTRLFGPGLSERAQRASTALRSLARGDGSNPDDRQGRLIVRDLKLPDKWEVRDVSRELGLLRPFHFFIHYKPQSLKGGIWYSAEKFEQVGDNRALLITQAAAE